MDMPERITRRGWIERAGVLLGTPAILVRGARGAAPEGRIERFEHKGVLIRDCTIPGDTRKDDALPANPNGMQVSKNKWLLVYSTRKFRGVDDDCSIVYQLRAGAPDGRLIKEGMLVRSHDQWDPFGDGSRYIKQHGHPVLFGVPRGALIDGKPAPNANVFVLKWRQVAKILDRGKNALVRGPHDHEISRRTQSVGWLQFRLNDREDDLEIIQPEKQLRQKGYESGKAFCSRESVVWMNQTFTQAVPLNKECIDWTDCNSFNDGTVAALKYVFNPKAGIYEWTETSPEIFERANRASESSLLPYRGSWLIAGRRNRGVAWVRTDDPFSPTRRYAYPASPANSCPLTAYLCPDGVVRLLTGDATVSPHKKDRDPLYCWDIDPDSDFLSSNRRVLFDSVAAGLPIRPAASPKIDMGKLLPHSGSVQYVVHRVSVRSANLPYLGNNGEVVPSIPIINDQEKAVCAIYYGIITYRDAFPSPWDFAPTRRRRA